MAPPILCLGQIRSGTTWLWEAFKASPNVWVPPLKELRILSGIDDLGETTCVDRFTAKGRQDGIDREWYDVTWHAYLDAMINQMTIWRETFRNDSFTKQSALELEFWSLYMGSTHSLKFYRELASTPDPLRLVDVSPDYLSCSSKFLWRAAKEIPEAQIIVLLRNPLDRLKSIIKWGYGHDEIVRTDDRSAAADWLYSREIMPSLVRHLNTATRLRTVIDAFGPERIFIGYFDDIVLEPHRFLDSLAAFLSVTFGSIPEGGPVNESAGSISPEMIAELESFAFTDLISLAREIPTVAEIWRKRQSGQEAAWKFSSAPLMVN